MIASLGAKLVADLSLAVSASGHSLFIVSYARVEIALGRHKTFAKIHFTNNPDIKPGKTYDVIIGCDVLRLFPPIKRDMHNGTFSIQMRCENTKVIVT